MPINKDILAKHLNPIFIETGTLRGEAAQMALDVGFETVWTVEFDPSLAESCRRKFQGNNSVKVARGDSGEQILPFVLGADKPTTFWLDAHPPGEMTLLMGSLPLVRELAAISMRKRLPGDVILIDDMRLFPAMDVAMLTQFTQILFPGCKVDRIDSPIASGDILRIRPKA